MTATDAIEPVNAHEHALKLAALGLRVLPIKSGRKHPPMASWQHAATNDAHSIDNWFNGLYRDCGVGLALGPQPCGLYLFAVDVDTHDPAHDGWEELADLEFQHGKLPDTWRSLTGAGGAHLIYAAPPGITVRNQQASGNRIAPGIDIRGDGGQIVVAPTTHPDTGRAYAWEHGYAPWQQPVAVAPDWLLELVKEPDVVVPITVARAPETGTVFDLHRADWTWETELLNRGWTQCGTRGGDTYWARPGKDRRAGHSAVLHAPGGPLVIFTTEIPPQWTAAGSRTHDGSGWAFGAFGFYAATEHNGDRSAAARALNDRYGITDDVDLAGLVEIVTLPPVDPNNDALLDMLLDWQQFWATDHKAEEWLWEPVIAAKRSTAMFAPGGTGKSLVALHIAVSVALEGHHVLYLDYEMTEDDLADRLEDMGYDDQTNLDHLHYALLPSLPGLDQEDGGKAVVLLAELCDAELVVIDTFGRAVHGDENDADTVRAWYRWTGLHLKHAGRAFFRLDHAGKDLTKGQRGSSAKNDDVDVVWQLRTVEDGYQLVARKRRMGWIPETVHLHQTANPLRFTADNKRGDPEGTTEAVALLDRLGVPVELSYRPAGKLIREAGHKVSNAVLRAAVAVRKAAIDGAQMGLDGLVDNSSESAPESVWRTVSENGSGAPSGAPSADASKTGSDLRTSQTPAHSGAPSVSNSGAPPLYKSGAPEDHPKTDPLAAFFGDDK